MSFLERKKATLSVNDALPSVSYLHRYMLRFLIFVLVLGMASAEPPEKALRYHKLLLKRPEDETVMTRFLQAWQEGSTERELMAWLKEETGEGDANWRVLAAYQQSLGLDDEALRALDRAVAEAPEKGDLRMVRAKLRARMLKFDEAFEDLDQVEKNDVLAKDGARLRGSWLARAGQMEKAATVWEEALEKFPKDEELREDLIELQVIEGMHQAAADSAAVLVAGTRDPYKKALRQLRMAEIRVLGGERAKGLKIYEEVMAATGGGTWLEREVLAQTRRVYMREDDVKGYRDFLQKLREDHPRRVALHRALAEQMALAGEMKEAVGLYREVLKMTPGDLGNLERFILFLEENDQWEEAKVEVQELLKRRGDEVSLWKQLAGLESRLNNGVGVEAALAEVEKRATGSAVELVATSMLYDEFGLGEKAEGLLRKGRESFPESDEVIEAFANLLLKNGKRDEAKGIWLGIAKSGSREELLRVSRKMTVEKMRESALQVIFDRMEEFEDDVLVLTQLCQLTKTKEEGERILPHALRLVRLAKSSTELEGAIPLALSVSRIARRRAEVAEGLKAMNEPGVGDWCLLAELLDGLKDEEGAREALKKVEGDLMGEFYWVSFDERRRFFRDAVNRLEKIVARPGQKKTVHLRRLTSLYRRMDNVREAMKWVEEWKRVAPGDHLAWMVRSDLLTSQGRHEEAITELSRLVAKFGPEEGRRVKLAEAQSRMGNGRAAQKLYRQMYEEAESTEEKLRWLEKWTKLAAGDGTLKDFIEEFQARKRANPKAVAPLLALAEIYGILGRGREQRMALEEAADRREMDPHLLIRLADLEADAGQLNKAVALLKKADLVDRGELAKKALVDLYWDEGMVEKSLEAMKTIPSQLERPRQVEVRVVEVIKEGHWKHAEKYLEDLLPKFPEDWRLKYLAAVMKKQNWEWREAMMMFQELEKAEGEIAGLTPGKTTPLQGREIEGKREWTPEMWDLWREWGQMTGGRRDFVDRENTYRVLLTERTRSPFQLPVSAEEVRRKSYLWGLILNEMEGDEERREKGFDEIIARQGDDWRRFGLAKFRPKKYRDELEKMMGEKEGELRWLQEWLVTKVADEDRDEKKLQEVLGRISQNHPQDALDLLPALVSGEVVNQEDGWKVARESFERLKGMGKEEGLRKWLAFGKSLNPGEEKKALLTAEVLKMDEIQANPEDLKPLAIQALARQDEEALVGLLNAMVRGMKEFKAPRNNEEVINLGYSVFQNSGADARDGLRTFRGWSLDWLVGAPEGQGQKMEEGRGETKVTPKRKRELFEKLKMEGDRNLERMDFLENVAGKVESRALKGMILWGLGEAGQIAGWEAGDDPDELFFAACYRAEIGEHGESWKLLEKANGMIEKREDFPGLAIRTVVSAKDRLDRDEGIGDLEKIREAMKVAEPFLAQKQANELREAFEMPPNPGQSNRVVLSKSWNLGAAGIQMLSGSGVSIEQLILKLASAKKEKAVELAVMNLRWSEALRRGSEFPMASISPMGETLIDGDLLTDVLEALKPAQGAGVKELEKFVRTTKALGRRATVARYYGKILEIDPENLGARIGQAVMSQELGKDWAELFSLRDHGEEAYERVQLFLAETKERMIDEMSLRVIDGYLRGLPEEYDRERYLWWVIEGLEDFVKRKGGHLKRRGLFSDMERSYLRSILTTLIKRSRYSDRAFAMLLPLREEHEIENEELSKAANLSLRVRLQAGADTEEGKKWPGLQIFNIPLILIDGQGTLSVPQRKSHLEGPARTGERGMDLDYLLELSGGSEVVGIEEETLVVIGKHDPELSADLETARNISKEGVYEKWVAALPEDEGLQHKRVVRLVKCLVKFGVEEGKWLDEFQIRYARALAAGGMRENAAFLVGDWFELLGEKGGEERVRRQVSLMMRAVFGNQEQWPIFDELGVGNFPDQFEERFEHLAKAIEYQMDMNRGSFAVFKVVSEGGMDSVTRVFRRMFLDSWPEAPISGALLYKLLKQNGVLDRNAEEGLSVERAILVIEGMLGQSELEEVAKVDLRDFLKKDEEIEPFLKKVLLFFCGEESELREELDRRHELVLEMEKRHPEIASEFLGMLYPSFERSGVLAEVLERMRKVELKVRVKALEDGISNGLLAYQNKGEDGDELLFRVFLLDASAAARAAEKVLLENYKQAKTTQRRRTYRVTSSPGGPMDLLINGMMRSMMAWGTDIEIERYWTFYNALMRGEAGKLVSNPYLAVGRLIGRGYSKADEGGAKNQGVIELLEKLSKEERQVFVTLSFKLILRDLVGPLKEGEMKVMGEELAESLPVVGDLLSVMRLAGANAEDQRDEVDERLGRFLAKCDLPPALKMGLIFELVDQPFLRGSLIKGNNLKRMTDWMEVYVESEKGEIPDIVFKTLAKFRKAEYETMGEGLGRFVEIAGRLVQADETTNKKNYSRLEALRSLVEGALIGGKAELLGKIFEENEEYYRGNLAMMWELERAGLGELIEEIRLGAKELYPIGTEIVFGKKGEEILKGLLERVPEDDRYRVEVLFSAMKDEEGEDVSTKGKAERLRKLAGRFAEEKPKTEVAKVQVLKSLISEDSAYEMVKGEIRELSEREGLGTILNSLESDPTAEIRYEMVQRILREEIQSGELGSFMRHFRSLLMVGRRVESRAAKDGGEFLKQVADVLIAEAAQDDAKARERLLLVRSLFVETRKAKGDDWAKAKKTAEVLAVVTHVLANSSWQEALGQVPVDVRESYEKGRRQGVLFARMELLKSERWSAAENGDVRKKVVGALLEDEFMKTELERAPLLRLGELTRSGFVSEEELKIVIDGAGKKHPMRASLLLYRASKTKEYEKASALFLEAAELASREKEEVLREKILFEYAVRAFYEKKDEVAEAILEEMDPDKLNKGQRLRIEEMKEKE